MKKMIQWTGIGLVVLFLGLQFVRPAKTNPPVDEAHHLVNQLEVPDEVSDVFRRACYDCHSNDTRWPWYSKFAPVSWFVIDHVNHGRRHLNFSDWARYSRQDQEKTLAEIQETVRSNAMPLSSYTLIHRDAVLSDTDKKMISDWANAQRQRLSHPASPR
jgi:hypothetical protein